MIKKILILTIAFSLFGCAKNRDVERVRAQDKEDVLAKSSYLGDQKSGSRNIWLGKMTVVDTSDSPGGHIFIGFQGDVKIGYFDFNQDSMQYRSIKGQYEGKETENIKNSVLLNWNIEHLDYALDENDGQTTNKEIQDNFKTWNQKKYFKIKWDSNLKNENQMLPSSSFAAFSCWEPQSVRRVENSMKIEPDHIGFKVEVVYQQLPACGSGPQWNEGDFNFTVTYMYSFKKAEPSDYEPKYFTNEQDPNRYKYGHFQTVHKILKPQNGRPHNLFMENRWAEKTHHFYFVKGFPERYKWIWKEKDENGNPLKHSVLGQTNALLESMGSKLRFEIHEYNYNLETGKNDGPAREFGDLRYSFINFIDQLEAGGTPFGYGPSDTNPFTGEIIAANTMVWTGMLDYYMELIETVGSEANDDEGPKESSLFSQMKLALTSLSSGEINLDEMMTDWDQSKGVGQLFKRMAEETRYAYPGWNSYTKVAQEQIVVPGLIEKYKPINFVEAGQTSKLGASVISQIVDLPQSRIPFKLDTRINESNQFEVKVLNPYAVIDTSWMNKFSSYSDSSTGIPVQQKNVTQILDVLKNLGRMTDKNLKGPADINSIADAYFKKTTQKIHENQDGHCIIDMDEFAGGLAGYLSATKMDINDPAVREDMINTVLFRVSIHEFGHNLNLRHNFYGSVDQQNFAVDKPNSIANFKDSNGLKVLDQKGNVIPSVKGFPTQRVQVSSSVMDYLRLEDELNTPWVWEDYDVAAIRDSYQPTKFDDQGELYLFCTDEHTATSALCNRHDLGTTPSQILMSQIRSYDERYPIRNKRYGRAYWGAGGYDSAIFETMVSMKEFLPLWRAGLSEDLVKIQLEKLGVKNNLHDQYIEELNREMRKVMMMTMAFYQAVIQQSRGDRDYRSEYDETTGALKQIGIVSDKIYAMMLLAGDDPIFYNPNRVMIHNSFLTYSNEPNVSEFTDRLWRNVITDRNIAMDPWFINFSRFLYAKNATNSSNEDAANLINIMKIVRVDNAQDLFSQYGLTMEASKPTLQTTLPKSKGTFNKGDEVVVIQIDGKYYMTDISEGQVTYALFQGALDKLNGAGDENDQSIQQFKKDVREFYWLYDFSTSGGF